MNPNHIFVGYAHNKVQMLPETFASYLASLPTHHKDQILKYRFWQDAQSCLYGKLLLLTALKDQSIHDLTLQDISYTAYQRPCFQNSAIDFNISHSGQIVVCAMGFHTRVGIDIEEIKGIDTKEFEDQFSPMENAFINAAESLSRFYNLWTRKEAIVKANGKGLSLPLKSVSVLTDEIDVEADRWHLIEIPVSKNYHCHLATSLVSVETLNVTEYFF